MVWQTTPYTIPLLTAGAVSAGLLTVAVRSRDKRGAIPLGGVLVAAIIWSVGDAVRLSTTDETLKVVMNDVRFLAPILVTVSIFLFAAEYTNRNQWLTRRRIAGLFAVHAVTFVLVWTNPWHGLVRQGVTLHSDPGFVLMEIQWGPWYYVHAAYSYVLLVGAALMLVDQLRHSGDVDTYRGQTLTILVAQVVPWGMNAAFIAGMTEVDLTPFGFVVTGGMFAIAMFRYQILDIVPIARSTVVENVDEGYLVVDTDDQVVDVNDIATDIIGMDRESVIGTPLADIFQDYPTVLERFGEERDAREQIWLEVDGNPRYYDVDISPIYDRRDQFTGRVILFRDITDQERRKQQLEEQKTQLENQNERLEDFASIVSHDLRNPINVISGRLELARQNPADEHFEEIAEGVERMETIVDDVLTMARQGQTVDERERVDLAELCAETWGNVHTEQATLDVRTERTVRGDRKRLLHVFENLFRNAIDHGRGDVSVTVGDLDDGFYVEDDGPGISEDERDAVLEKGYTTAEDGTGFGLAIVETAVEAHGWRIEVTERDDGGARFEVRGLSTTGPLDSEQVADT
jgi:PAS domain S-box-containing protein